MSSQPLKSPAAWLPIAMSLVAFAVVLGHIAFFGHAREADEGPAAHLFQILMAGQLPIIAFFALKWLPQDASHAARVLGMQIAAALVACAPVWYFHL